jgi:O-antigen/teichoic acid export membrane protein
MSSAGRVARNTGFLAVGDIASKFASLAFYAVMARTLEQEGFGDFTFALSLALLLAAFDTGVDPLVTRGIARRRDDVHNLFWNALAIKLTAGVVGTALAVAVAVAGGYDGTVQGAVAILSVSAVLQLSTKTIYATFQGVEDMGPIAVSSVIERFSTAAMGITLMALGLGLVPVSLCYLGGTLLAAGYAGRALVRRGIRPALRLSSARVRSLATASFAIALGGILSTFLFRIDAVMLSLLKDNVAVGFYGAAYRLLESTLFLSFAFVGAMLPVLARLGRNTDPTLGRTFEAACKVIFAVLLPIGAGFVLFAEPVIRLLFGDSFVDAASAVRLLGGAAVLYGFNYLAWYALISQGRERIIPWITGAVALENVVLNLLLIPRYSFDGAAAVTTVSELTLAVLFGIATLRLTGPISIARIAAGPLIACAGMVGVALALGSGWVALGGGIAAYAILLLVVERRLFPADVQLILDSVLRRAPA